MSRLKVTVQEVSDICEHKKADKLELAQIMGWKCIIGKGDFRVGDRGVYFPIDSVLPEELSDYLGVTQYLKNGRIKTVKLRGKISQGLFVRVDIILDYLRERCTAVGKTIPEDPEVGYDFRRVLIVEKYEPTNQVATFGLVRERDPGFPKYDLESIRNFINFFDPKETVAITEKLDGTSIRVKIDDRGLSVGSKNHNLVDPDTLERKVKNLYWSVAKNYRLEEKIPFGYQLFGEVVGAGISRIKKNIYGYPDHRLFIYDIINLQNGDFLSHNNMKDMVRKMDLDMVPVLYVGKWNEELLDLAYQNSRINSKVNMEGIVIKSAKGGSLRKAVKYINEKYLVKYGDSGRH